VDVRGSGGPARYNWGKIDPNEIETFHLRVGKKTARDWHKFAERLGVDAGELLLALEHQSWQVMMDVLKQ
jgi:hypothetical protein